MTMIDLLGLSGRNPRDQLHQNNGAAGDAAYGAAFCRAVPRRLLAPLMLHTDPMVPGDWPTVFPLPRAPALQIGEQRRSRWASLGKRDNLGSVVVLDGDKQDWVGSIWQVRSHRHERQSKSVPSGSVL